MDIGYAMKCCRDAVDLLLSVQGASAFAESNPIQRVWRDLEMASRHGLLSGEVPHEIYGRALVGNFDALSPFVWPRICAACRPRHNGGCSHAHALRRADSMARFPRKSGGLEYAALDDRDPDGSRRKLGWERGGFGGAGQWQRDCASSRSRKLCDLRGGGVWRGVVPASVWGV